MATPQAYISFTGIANVIGGNFLLDRGVKPSAGEIVCIPQALYNSIGTLAITYVYDIALPGFSQTMTFPDCVITSVAIDGIGTQSRMRISFVDDRYWWQFSHIDGEYNKPTGVDGETENPMGLRDLMLLCLEALPNVGSFDISAVDNSAKPHVTWRGDRADLALEELCNQFNYVVVRTIGHGVIIGLNNNGYNLPTIGAEKTLAFSAAGGALPDSLRIACGNVSYQCKLLLEAVGEEPSGEIRPIDKLSYKPDDGWSQFSFPEFPNVIGNTAVGGGSTALASFARKSVYKWYRVKNQAHTTANFAPPGYVGDASEINEIKKILPLIGDLNATQKDSDGKYHQKKAFVVGEFYLEDGLKGNTTTNTVYPYSFSLDAEKGIVKFSDFVFKLFEEGSSPNKTAIIKPAVLALYCTCHVTEPDTNVKQYYGYTATAGGARGVHTIQQTKLIPRVTANYDGNTVQSVDDNFDGIDELAETLADGEIAKMTPQNGCVVEYQGIRWIELDGLRRQVEWRVGDGQPSQTKASYGTEINSFEPTYHEFLEQNQRRLEARRSRRVFDDLTQRKELATPVQ